VSYELTRVATSSEWRAYHTIRRTVLWEARGRGGYDQNHADEYVTANHALLLKFSERGIGTTRLDDFGDGRGAVRLVAIASDKQGQGHGRVLARRVEDYARRLGLNKLHVNAAPEALGFYQKLGWTLEVWDGAELVGIASDCVQMTKILSPNF